MTSVAQIEANRRNAQKSTGPQTPEGIAACCRNATKHGLFSSQVLLRGESAEELDQHVQGIRQSIRPVGYMEELLTDQISAHLWRMKRLLQMETAVLNQTLCAEETEPTEGRGEERNADAGTERNGEGRRGEAGSGAACAFLNEGLPGLDKLRRYWRALEQSYQQAFRELGALQKARWTAEAAWRQRQYERQLAEEARAAEEAEERAGNERPNSNPESSREPRHNGQAPASASPANGTEPVPGAAASAAKPVVDAKRDAATQADPKKDAEKGDATTRKQEAAPAAPAKPGTPGAPRQTDPIRSKAA